MKLKFSNATKESWWKQELYGAQEPSLETGRMPPLVPWGLAWCPRAEPRHVTRANIRALMRATGPCLVPMSRAKTRDACHLPCHDNYNDPRHGARGCARTRAPCHDACHDLHAMVPRPEAWHVPHATARATTPIMTHSMVVEGVPRDVARAMVRAISGFWPWCLDKVGDYGLLLVTECYLSMDSCCKGFSLFFLYGFLSKFFFKIILFLDNPWILF